jgi:hypothetical protein
MGNTKLGEAPTGQGVATPTLSFSNVAKDMIVLARYPGDAYHKPSSKAVKQVVVAAP